MTETVTAATGERARLQSTLTTGLETSPDYDPKHPSLCVTWIHWHSAFRGTGLRVGDQIIAVDGAPVVYPSEQHELQRLVPTLIGRSRESQRWADQGATEDTPVTITVRRRRVPGEGWEVLDFRGRIRADRIYSDEGGQQLLGSGGPAILAKPSFDFGTSWGVWYAEFQKQAAQALADAWRSRSSDSRYLLTEHLATRSRVDFLAKHYPGPFSQAVREDWDAVRSKLEGRRYQLTASGLASWEQEEPPPQSIAGLPPDTASPREVLEAMVSAVKAGDEDTFRQLFISWRATSLGNGRPLYYPHHDYSLDPLWTDSRWLIAHRIADARVVWTGDVYTLIPANPAEGVPRVDAVDVQLEHVGVFDGVYRAWRSVLAHPAWELQRVDGGPWRISSIQGL